MFADSRVSALHWQALVDEALRRRKAEGLTQRDHAALAGVSVPTLAAFERGEHSLTLGKAFDILRVVGLLVVEPKGGAQGAFVRQAMQRWQELTQPLPADSPARFQHGWYRIDYWLDGPLKQPPLTEFERTLRGAVRRNTGWPLFLVLSRPALAPREHEGAIECWLPPDGDEIERAMSDAAHCDYWRALPSARLVTLRGYQEDGQDTFAPGTIFDTTLPVWRLGEGLLHAARLAALLQKSEPDAISVHFRATYSGLAGRVLRAWANPMTPLLLEGRGARSNEAVLEVTVAAATIPDRLAHTLFPLVSSLFERFGIVGMTEEAVGAEVDRLLKSNQPR